jgi:hypothetical protein
MADNVGNEGKLLTLWTIFTASSGVHAWEFLSDLSAVLTVISLISHSFSITVSEQYGTALCSILKATCISV